MCLLKTRSGLRFSKALRASRAASASAGGLINYVTKRPALVKTLDTATDHRGTTYASLDLGQLFGSKKQFGLRTNLAGEEIKSYVENANGWRVAGANAADWNLSNRLFLKTDFEYQHKVERSEAGYQLLGGADGPGSCLPIRDAGRCSPGLNLIPLTLSIAAHGWISIFL